MSALAVVVIGPDPARALSALGIASAAAALGRDVALLFDGPGVGTLEAVADALATALSLGVRVSACTTGLADHAVALPPGVEPGGIVAFLAANPAAQLLTV